MSLALLQKQDKVKKPLTEQIEQSLIELDHISQNLYLEVEKYVKQNIPSPIPGASEKVLLPVFAYCLKAPVKLGRAYDLDTYKFEVKKCITSYVSRVLGIQEELVDKLIEEAKTGGDVEQE